MNLYRIKNSESSEWSYIQADNLLKAIKRWKEPKRTNKDPEIVEWISDSIIT